MHAPRIVDDKVERAYMCSGRELEHSGQGCSHAGRVGLRRSIGIRSSAPFSAVSYPILDDEPSGQAYAWIDERLEHGKGDMNRLALRRRATQRFSLGAPGLWQRT